MFEGVYVYIWICVTGFPRHNVWSTEGRFTALRIPDAGLVLKYRTCQAHRDAFFLRHIKRKGGSVPRPCVWGQDGESAGGNGKEVTLVT